MFEPDLKFENAYLFARLDEQELLSTASAHPIQLDGQTWPTAEHYYQANKFNEGAHQSKVAFAKSAEEAHKLGNQWFKPKRSDFKKVRKVLMTRALYSKARQHPEVQAALLGTQDKLIAERSQYGHFWGIGRDQRGENHMGKIWMDIRARIKNMEAEEQQ